MATESHKLQLGRKIPDFALPSVDGKHYGMGSFTDSKALLVAFICRHCPYVMEIEDRLIALAKAFPKEQFQLVGICSNNWEEYPEDAPHKLLERWRQKNYGFPYLIDETQEVAKIFGAVCTPDLFLFDDKRQLYYHGDLDELSPALNSLLVNQPAPTSQRPTIGCSIKWKEESPPFTLTV